MNKRIFLFLVGLSLFLFGCTLQTKKSYINSDWNNSNRTISKATTTVNINFQQCTPDNEIVYFGLGSTNIVIEEKKNDRCIMSYGGEIEGGFLGSHRCEIPTNTNQQFFINNMGIDFTELDKFCISK